MLLFSLVSLFAGEHDGLVVEDWTQNGEVVGSNLARVPCCNLEQDTCTLLHILVNIQAAVAISQHD